MVLVVELTRERMRELRRNPDETDALTEALTRAVRSAISRDHSVALHRCVVLQTGGIPRTTSGKVRRRAAAEAWQRGALAVLGRS